MPLTCVETAQMTLATASKTGCASLTARMTWIPGKPNTVLEPHQEFQGERRTDEEAFLGVFA